MARTTVVVATRDRVGELARTLGFLRELDVPVVVVDNGSTDGTVARVRREFPEVRLIPLERNVGASARNVGVRAAGTPYVAFSDDDSWWAPGALRRSEELFDAHPGLGLIAARVVVEPGGELDPVCRVMAASPLGVEPDLPGPSVLGFVCCGSVVRRDAFLEVGGFSPVLFFIGEERLLSWDLAVAGYACCYVDDVVAHHQPSLVRGPAAARRRAELRNDLLTTWLRRPWRRALAGTVALLGRGVGDPDARGALGSALLRLPVVARQRRVLPPDVERRVLAVG
ncbi:glycosyltransferase [Actinosynnema sp. NPDC047251]|uniref:Glycosyltransferase, family 2 n=1 Tax=Saccharothrix espanaensis (strain ATCC 51144 / DSM 44229 / JCM 9112 / NBRC 15066 / NRRL 15764) TaxID=1179773 RepID=K0JWT8_SACES|nr:glycosyltransferase [Saccharothrix espanaensis]CCH32330.1 Glycosyltransferase, family 2 [Saccharothrix espanaensis DSM 44229]